MWNTYPKRSGSTFSTGVYAPLYSVLSQISHRDVNRYGEPIRPLPRRVIARGMSQQVSIELRPPSFKVFQLATSISGTVSAKSLVVSMGETIRSMNAQLARLIMPEIQPLPPYRVWRVEIPDPDEWTFLEFPVNKLPKLSGTLVEESDHTLDQKDIQPSDVFVVEFRQGDSWLAQLPQTAPPPTVKGPPPPPAPLFNSNEGFFNRMSKTTASSASTSVMTVETYRSSFSLANWSKTTTSLKGKKSIERGTLGLGNMSVRVTPVLCFFCLD